MHGNIAGKERPGKIHITWLKNLRTWYKATPTELLQHPVRNRRTEEVEEEELLIDSELQKQILIES